MTVRVLGMMCVVVGAVLVLSACAEVVPGVGSYAGGSTFAGPDPDDTSVAAAYLKLGDCYTETDDGDVDEVVPCTSEHNDEVYAVVDLSADSGITAYPGDIKVEELADVECLKQFEPFVGTPYDDSVVDYWYFTPTEDGWAGGDHSVVCTAYDLKKWTTTGSLKGSGR